MSFYDDIVGKALHRLREYTRYYGTCNQQSRDIHTVLVDYDATKQHASQVGPQLERMIDRYNAKCAELAEANRKIMALSSLLTVSAHRCKLAA